MKSGSKTRDRTVMSIFTESNDEARRIAQDYSLIRSNKKEGVIHELPLLFCLIGGYVTCEDHTPPPNLWFVNDEAQYLTLFDVVKTNNPNETMTVLTTTSANFVQNFGSSSSVEQR
jgi:hypothetical protein